MEIVLNLDQILKLIERKYIIAHENTNKEIFITIFSINFSDINNMEALNEISEKMNEPIRQIKKYT